MLSNSPPAILLATQDSALQAAFTPVLIASGADVRVVGSGRKVLEAMVAAPLPALILLDVRLEAKLPGAKLYQLLASARAGTDSNLYSIVLIADTVPEEWSRRLAEGVIDDVIPRSVRSPHWKLRLDAVLRQCHRLLELDRLHRAAQQNGPFDMLLGVYNRGALLSILFRETDRVQRLRTALSLLLYEIDDFDHWQSRIGKDACDGFLQGLVQRSSRLLRSYDTFGRTGHHQFLAILPGCSTVNATILAERIRMEVFSAPFQSVEEAFRLSACFGIASSQGRSPIVVLREAEIALQRAQAAGPESILCFASALERQMDPIAFLS
jgi:two-component system cell cycle response regulator